MKKYIRRFLYSGILLACISLASCEDYLDKSPESTVSGDDAFKDFQNFQGFTEELYYCIPDFAHGYWSNSFNWGEDEFIAFGINYYMTYKIDIGNFWGWQSSFDGWQSGWMDRSDTRPNSGDRFHKSLWPLAWYGIRKANLGLENLDKLTNATTEERNLIEGQLYFFRAWFHFQLMQYFGGLPYIQEVPSSSEKLTYPRLSYHECADLAAADFRKAADLLPINWDNTTAGKATFGNNQLRINKIMALGFLGKNYLWAGSPLMNQESTGSSSYNTSYCQKAAETFAELLKLVENGETQYALETFDNYSDVFYTYQQNFKNPGSTEAIFQTPVYDAWMGSGYCLGPQYMPKFIGDGGIIFSPTANYVNYYGMQNGLPLDDPNSGFNKEFPWKGRDPRFYHDIVYDGVKVVKNSGGLENENDQYANLYTDGSYRDPEVSSRSGYLLRKFRPLSVNKYDDGARNYGFGLHIQISWMRLADIYLMYAEAAANGYGSANGKASGFSKTAVEALNAIRERAGVDPVDSKFLGSTDSFMNEVRRERAVELSFEAHRFNDLRRWLLLTVYPYNVKTSQEFIRINLNKDDATQSQVANFKEVEVIKRNFGSKHYWLPLKTSETSIYLEFSQNPGW